MKHSSVLLSLLFSIQIVSTHALSAPIFKAKSPVAGEYIIVASSHDNISINSKNEREVEIAKHRILELSKDVEARGGQVLNQYLYAILGLHVRLPAQEVLALSQDSRIQYIEEVKRVQLIPEHRALNFDRATRSWGIDRIDQRTLPLDGNYTVGYAGEGTHAYIVDTGMYPDHQEFTGRVGNGVSFVPGDPSTGDCHGHGTHVAGTIGGMSVGVAPKTILHPIRVLGCQGNGTFAEVISGINWIISNHIHPAVINMSLQGEFSQAVNDSVANAVKAGIVSVVAAGNQNTDACRSSPSSEPSAITVGATDPTDARAWFSNWGSCLDIFAPGQNIISSARTGSSDYISLSGTSMASPHVAGAALLYLGVNSKATPAQVSEKLKMNATPGLPTNPGTNSPQLLLYVKDFVPNPLIVNAGPDVFLHLPNVDTTLTGIINSTQGEIVSIQWEQIRGPRKIEIRPQNSLSAVLTLRNLEIGEYEFILRAVDSAGNKGEDSVKIIVLPAQNLPPQATIIGNSIKINPGASLTLDGSKSSDADGTILYYRWENISGPQNLTFATPTSPVTTVTGQSWGTYSVRLTVTDNGGAIGSADYTFIINSPPKVSPILAQTLILPMTSTTISVNATDPENQPLSYAWIALSTNPKSVKLEGMNTSTISVSDMTLPGVYQYFVYVLDEMQSATGAFASVTVMPQASTMDTPLN